MMVTSRGSGVDQSNLAACRRLLPGAAGSGSVGAHGRPRLARRLRPCRVMTQARNAISRKISNLAGPSANDAGQKARIGWQGLPGAEALEAVPCR
jgi:hypothetical protein